jgi:hypothetical protein
MREKNKGVEEFRTKLDDIFKRQGATNPSYSKTDYTPRSGWHGRLLDLLDVGSDFEIELSVSESYRIVSGPETTRVCRMIRSAGVICVRECNLHTDYFLPMSREEIEKEIRDSVRRKLGVNEKLD